MNMHTLMPLDYSTAAEIAHTLQQQQKPFFKQLPTTFAARLIASAEPRRYVSGMQIEAKNTLCIVVQGNIAVGKRKKIDRHLTTSNNHTKNNIQWGRSECERRNDYANDPFYEMDDERIEMDPKETHEEQKELPIEVMTNVPSPSLGSTESPSTDMMKIECVLQRNDIYGLNSFLNGLIDQPNSEADENPIMVQTLTDCQVLLLNSNAYKNLVNSLKTISIDCEGQASMVSAILLRVHSCAPISSLPKNICPILQKFCSEAIFLHSKSFTLDEKSLIERFVTTGEVKVLPPQTIVVVNEQKPHDLHIIVSGSCSTHSPSSSVLKDALGLSIISKGMCIAFNQEAYSYSVRTITTCIIVSIPLYQTNDN